MVIGAILLVSGTAIGAGMLALPLETAQLGFWPSLLAYFVCWLAMLISALQLLVVCLKAPVGMNMMRLADAYLGAPSKWASLLCYLSLLYALLTAYTMGLGGWIIELLAQINCSMPVYGAYSLAALFLGLLLFAGIGWIDKINRSLMFLLVLSFTGLMSVTLPQLQSQHFTHHQLDAFWPALPIIVTAFGFHIIIPSLVAYLKKESKALLLSIAVGSFIPCLIYILWQIAIMGTLPLDGPLGLATIAQAEQALPQLTSALIASSGSEWLGYGMRAFAAAALITSFLGVALALFDNIQDTLSLNNRAFDRSVLCLMTLLPPTVCAIVHPGGFTSALYVAAIFVALLLGILPAALIWSQRSTLQDSDPKWQSFLAHPMLVLANLCFFVGIIVIEVIRIVD